MLSGLANGDFLAFRSLKINLGGNKKDDQWIHTCNICKFFKYLITCVQKQRNVSLWIDIKIFQNKSISVNN